MTTELLCWAIYHYGVEALDYLRTRGIPAKVLMAAVDRDTRHGYVNWGVSVWRPFLDRRGDELVRASLAIWKEGRHR